PEQPDGLEMPGADLVPALLMPFRDPALVRHDYPLLLPPHGDNGQTAT
ncbi:MAG: hypothetical protein GTO46_14340, partial [Gemmatimonadetes bacterium]|nr:hypothetical protein [Gemmatimonadota bacterium]